MNKERITRVGIVIISQFATFTTVAQIPEQRPKSEITKLNFKKNAIIIYDFNSKVQPDIIYQVRSKKPGDSIVYKSVDKLWYGKRVSLRVKINPYLYDVIISTRQANDLEVIDSMSVRFFTSSLLTLSENKKFLDSAKLITNRTEEAKPKPIDSTVNVITEEIGANANDSTSIANILSDSFSNVQEIAESFSENKLHARNFNLTPAKNSALEREFRIIARESRQFSKFIANQQQFHLNLSEFYASIRLLQSTYDICEYATLLALSDKKANDEIVTEIKEYIATENQGELDSFLSLLPSTLFAYKNTMDSIYESLQSSYFVLDKSYFDSKYYDVSLLYDSVSKSYADSLYFKFNRVKPEIFSKTFSLIVRNFQNSEAFYHVAPTELIRKDSLIYIIETKPSSNYKTLIEKYGIIPSHVGKFEYPIAVKGNFKLNFSVGAAFMFNSLRGKDYFFSSALENLPSDSSEVTIIEKKSGNSFSPAIAAYAHGYLKIGGWFTPAVTVGLSTNPTDFTNASYFVGLSLIYGQQNRFIFTFGRAGSNIDILKPKYDLNKTYLKKELTNIQEDDLMKKAFKAGWFFGVSYNISDNR